MAKIKLPRKLKKELKKCSTLKPTGRTTVFGYIIHKGRNTKRTSKAIRIAKQIDFSLFNKTLLETLRSYDFDFSCIQKNEQYNLEDIFGWQVNNKLL